MLSALKNKRRTSYPVHVAQLPRGVPELIQIPLKVRRFTSQIICWAFLLGRRVGGDTTVHNTSPGFPTPNDEVENLKNAIGLTDVPVMY